MPRLFCLLRIAFVALALALSAIYAAAAEPFSPVPIPVESFDVGTLHIDQFGTGAQSLILIPGLASGPWVWYGTIAKFAPNYRVYAITLPGFDGHASTKEKPLFTIFARDFWELLASKMIANPVVIGHSLGGTLAIYLAEEHPERLSAIVAADGLPVFPMLANSSAAEREAMATAMANKSVSHSQAEELEAQRNYMNTIGTNKPELVEAAARHAARSDSKAIAAWMQEDLANDLRPNLSHITISFLEIMPYSPPAANQPPGYTQEQTLSFYKSLIAVAPKATVIAVAPSRHFVMLDQPEAFYEAVTQVLASIHH